MNTKQQTNNQLAGKNEKPRSFFSFLFTFLLFLTFIGCQDPLNPGNILSDIPEGKGSFSLALSDTSRTILPVTPNLSDFAVYNLRFTKTNDNSVKSVDVDRTNQDLAAVILLNPGTYNLVVNAYKDSNKTQPMAKGTLNGVVITAGNNTTAAVTLEALLSGGTGTFRWSITLPSGVSANMIIAPGNAGGTAQQTVNLLTASGNRTLNSGPYNLTFNLTKTDGKSVVWKELLYVYQNLESVFTFTFTDAHLSDSNYTVSYNPNNGMGNLTQSVLHGGTLTRPADPSRTDYTFGGWYTDNNTFANLWNFNSPVTESFTLYARWNYVTLESLTSLAAKLAWLQTNAQSNSSYVLDVNVDESIGPHTLSYSGRSNITITLTGVGANRTVSLSSSGAMFTVVSGVTFILGNNITLHGRSENGSYDSDNNLWVYNNSMVIVNSGGKLTMNVGSTITGHTIDSRGGNNPSGGGVYVGPGGTFTMTGGKISGNTVTASLYAAPQSYGGGVYVGGTFTMNNGKISGNTATMGGGVRAAGTFTMNNGEISGNSATRGGGVYGTFTMNGGEISGNTAASINNGGYGGGVYYTGEGSSYTYPVKIVTGTIYGSDAATNLRNTASSGGAAIYGIATVGTFNANGDWVSNGTLNGTNNNGINNNTVRVVNGVLQ